MDVFLCMIYWVVGFSGIQILVSCISLVGSEVLVLSVFLRKISLSAASSSLFPNLFKMPQAVVGVLLKCCAVIRGGLLGLLVAAAFEV